MSHYELVGKLKERALNNPKFRKKLYKHLLEKPETSAGLIILRKLIKSLEELIMRDIRY